MKLYSLFVLAMVALLLAVAGLASAHEGDEDDPMDDHHMAGWGTFPLFGAGLIGYLFLAVPIGGLVYLDAQERGMNGPMWFALVLIPWVGLLVPLVYLLARRERTTGPTPGY
jgi:hypothetical protein